MSSQFSINTSRFVHERVQFPLHSESPEQRLRRSSGLHFRNRAVVDRDIKCFDDLERPMMKRLQTIEKVIHVATAIFLLIMPLGFSFFPAWLPWGVGLPTLLILAVLGAKVKQKIEVKERYYEALLIMRKMLNDHSFKALHPLGEWDLPAVDRRLKSDLVMQEELKRKHPESASRVELLVASLDLDVTPTIKLHAARKLSQGSENNFEWNQVKENVIEANKHFRQGEIEIYKAKMAEAKGIALLIGESIERKEDAGNGKDALYSLITSPPSAQAQVRSVIAEYQCFNQLFKELYHMHEIGKVLYGSEFCTKWQDYCASAEKIQNEIEKLTPLFERTDIPSHEWMIVAEEVKNQGLQFSIKVLIERTRQLDSGIQKMILQHPVMHIEAFKKVFADLDEKILQARTVIALGEWIKQNPEKAKRPICEVMQSLPYAEEIKEWFETHKDLIVDPVLEIYERNYLMRYEYQQANKVAKRWNQFNKKILSIPKIQKMHARIDFLLNLQKERRLTEKEIQKIGELRLALTNFEEEFKVTVTQVPSLEEVTAFNQNVIRPLRVLVGDSGEPSIWKRAWKSVSRKLPAHPFDPVRVPREKGFEKGRKIEELFINDLLKKVDREMVLTNRIRRYGLEWAAVSVLFIVQAIFWSNPWVAWGISASTLAIQGASLYIDRHLREANKTKQRLKMKMFLRDHPLIKQIPGSRPNLQEVSDVQVKYGLDDLTWTWAGSLAEGDDVVKVPASREEAVAICRETASKGSEVARPPLEQQLLYLRTLRARGDYQHEHEIERLQKVLYPPLTRVEKPAPKYIDTLASEWNRAVMYRKRVEEKLDLIAQEIVRLKAEIARFDEARRINDKILKQLSAIDLNGLRRNYQIETDLKESVQAACKGEQIRSESEDLEELLQEMHALAIQIYDEGNSDELTRRGAACYERLSRFPVVRLHPVVERLHVNCLKMKRNSQDYEKCNHRLNILHKEFGSFNRTEVSGQIEELGRHLDDWKNQLTKAYTEERVRKTLVALETQLILLDPQIEKKRRELIEHINMQGDSEIRKVLSQNLASLNRVLNKAKRGLARQLVRAAEEKKRELVKIALEKFPNEIVDGFQELNNRVKKEGQSPLQVALINQASSADSLLQQEIQLPSAFIQVDTLCNELKNLLDKIFNLREAVNDTPVKMLELAAGKKNHHQVWNIYFCLNRYVRGAVWWKLTPEVRNAIEELREKSSRLMVELESFTDESEILEKYNRLMREHQIAIFQKLPHRVCEEILRLEAVSREAKEHFKKVVQGEASGDKRTLFYQLLEDDQIELFSQLPLKVREELV